jgi:hypothetical protein
VNRIIVADVGLSPKSRSSLENICGKVAFVDTGRNSRGSRTVFSREWIEAVSQKTRLLLKIAAAGADLPLVMMDCDMVVMEDFSDVINPRFDMQVCRRRKPLFNPGIRMDYIASFVVVNSRAALPFVRKWCARIGEMARARARPPYETPAFNELIYKNSSLRIGSLPEDVVACDNDYVKGATRAIHVKSIDAGRDRISIWRFANVRHFPALKVMRFFGLKEALVFAPVAAAKFFGVVLMGAFRFVLHKNRAPGGLREVRLFNVRIFSYIRAVRAKKA